MHEVDYTSIARSIIAADRPSRLSDHQKEQEPSAAPATDPDYELNFGVPPEDNWLLPGSFRDGCFVCHLAAKREEEKGEYNVVVCPSCESSTLSTICSVVLVILFIFRMD